MSSTTSTYTLWPKEIEYERAIPTASLAQPSSSHANKQASLGMSPNGTVHHRTNPMFIFHSTRKRANSDPDNTRSALMKRPSFSRLLKPKSELVPIKLSIVAEDIHGPQPPLAPQPQPTYRPTQSGRRPSAAPSPAPSVPLPPLPPMPPSAPYVSSFPPPSAEPGRKTSAGSLVSPHDLTLPAFPSVPERSPQAPSLRPNDQVSRTLKLQISSPQPSPSPSPSLPSKPTLPALVSANQARPASPPVKKAKSRSAVTAKKVRFSDAAPAIIPAAPQHQRAHRSSTTDLDASQARRPSWSSVFLLSAPPPLATRPRLTSPSRSPSRSLSLSTPKPKPSAKSILRPVNDTPTTAPKMTHDLNPGLPNTPRTYTARNRMPTPPPSPPPKDRGSPEPDSDRLHSIIIHLPRPLSFSPNGTDLYLVSTPAAPHRPISPPELEPRRGTPTREHTSAALVL